MAAAGAALLLLAALSGTGSGATSERTAVRVTTADEPAVRPFKPVPVVLQALRNNCETAALSMLLAAAGVRADQLTLQEKLPRSGPLDPRPAPSGGLPVWGDPNLGFVGRPEGGGTAGGFGVYQGPIRKLALKSGVPLVDLSRRDPAVLYRRLAAGRPVMVWIGLSAGPYRRWGTPAGRVISANLGEHTVVLASLRGGMLVVNDPLVGERRLWTRARFERMWSLLGRRALGL